MLIGCFPFFVLAVCLQDDYFEILVWWLDIAEQKDDSLGPLSYYSDCYYFFWILVPDIDVPGSSDLFDFMTSWLHDFTTSRLHFSIIWCRCIYGMKEFWRFNKQIMISLRKCNFPWLRTGCHPFYIYVYKETKEQFDEVLGQNRDDITHRAIIR